MPPPPNTKPRASLPIGGLSRDTGVNIETIRYYERIGLLPPPPRSEGDIAFMMMATGRDWCSSAVRDS